MILISIYILKDEKHDPTNEFFDSLLSNMLLPYILHPTRIHGQSGPLTDNIFFNQFNKEAVSCNLTSTISDHLPQFPFVPSVSSDPPSSK